MQDQLSLFETQIEQAGKRMGKENRAFSHTHARRRYYNDSSLFFFFTVIVYECYYCIHILQCVLALSVPLLFLLCT